MMTEIYLSRRYEEANHLMYVFRESRDAEQRRWLLNQIKGIKMEFEALVVALEDFVDQAELELRTGE